MDLEKAKKNVKKVISNVTGNKNELLDDTALIGDASFIDSMKLVEICVALEDLAEEHNFEFDWTSETAMSKSRSMFRNVASLAKEFQIQSENNN